MERISVKALFLFLGLSLALMDAGSLTDKAYRAYRAKNYIRAFKLYREGSREGDLKAIYNLAVMYEKGLGTEKNLEKANVLYGMVIMALQDNDRLNDPAVCKSKMLPYYYKALSKLSNYEENLEYMQKERSLKDLCCESYTDPFLRKCPAARVVKKEDRYRLENFKCHLYRKYPQTMKKLLALHSKYREALTGYRPEDERLRREKIKKNKALKMQIKTTARPIIEAYLKEAETCVEKAETRGELKRCTGLFYSRAADLLQPGPKPIVESEWFFASPEKKKRMAKENRKKATPDDKQEYLEKIRRYFRSSPLKNPRHSGLAPESRATNTHEPVNLESSSG